MKFFKALIYNIVISLEGLIFAWQRELHEEYNGHGASYLVLFLVGLTGYFAWRTLSVKWVSKLWISIYASVFFLAALFWFCFKIFPGLSIPLITFYTGVRVFFISPMPFIILYLVATLSVNGSRFSKSQSK